MGVRLLLALCLCAAAFGARTEETKPQKIVLGPATLEIVAKDDIEKELRHGGRVLIANYGIELGPVVKTEKFTAAVFEIWAGGNACGAWPAVVSVDAAGKVEIDIRFEDECQGFSVAVEAEGFLFVQQPFPGRDGSAWRYSPGSGFKRLGVLEFQPQPNTSWADLDKALDHPTSLFDIAPVDAAVRRLMGSAYAGLASSLDVASPVEKRGERFLVGSGCQAHACGVVEGFIGIDRTTRAVFLAQKNEGRIRTWPALGAWPAELRREFESWRKG